jgi:hypothetical protein
MKMKKRILVNSALFIVIVIILNVLSYHFLAKPVLYKDYIVSKKELKKHKNFWIGDSHANVIPQEFLNSINAKGFAFNSDSYFDSYIKIKFLTNHFEIDTIYLSVDNHNLSMYRQWWTNRDRSVFYANYKTYNKYYPIKRIDFMSKKYVNFYFPLLNTKNSKLFKEYIYLRFSGKKPRTYEDFDFSTVPVEQRIQKSEERIEIQFPEKEKSKALEKCLNEMISVCKEKNITLIGIKFPLTKEYIKEMGSMNYGADSLFYVNNLPVYDYQRLYIDKCNYFRDQDHLNNLGAEKFIKLLNKYIKQSKQQKSHSLTH